MGRDYHGVGTEINVQNLINNMRRLSIPAAHDSMCAAGIFEYMVSAIVWIIGKTEAVLFCMFFSYN